MSCLSLQYGAPTTHAVPLRKPKMRLHCAAKSQLQLLSGFCMYLLAAFPECCAGPSLDDFIFLAALCACSFTSACTFLTSGGCRPWPPGVFAAHSAAGLPSGQSKHPKCHWREWQHSNAESMRKVCAFCVTMSHCLVQPCALEVHQQCSRMSARINQHVCD